MNKEIRDQTSNKNINLDLKIKELESQLSAKQGLFAKLDYFQLQKIQTEYQGGLTQDLLILEKIAMLEADKELGITQKSRLYLERKSNGELSQSVLGVESRLIEEINKEVDLNNFFEDFDLDVSNLDPESKKEISRQINFLTIINSLHELDLENQTRHQLISYLIKPDWKQEDYSINPKLIKEFGKYSDVFGMKDLLRNEKNVPGGSLGLSKKALALMIISNILITSIMQIDQKEASAAAFAAYIEGSAPHVEDHEIKNQAKNHPKSFLEDVNYYVSTGIDKEELRKMVLEIKDQDPILFFENAPNYKNCFNDPEELTIILYQQIKKATDREEFFYVMHMGKVFPVFTESYREKIKQKTEEYARRDPEAVFYSVNLLSNVLGGEVTGNLVNSSISYVNNKVAIDNIDKFGPYLDPEGLEEFRRIVFSNPDKVSPSNLTNVLRYMDDENNAAEFIFINSDSSLLDKDPSVFKKFIPEDKFVDLLMEKMKRYAMKSTGNLEVCLNLLPEEKKYPLCAHFAMTVPVHFFTRAPGKIIDDYFFNNNLISHEFQAKVLEVKDFLDKGTNSTYSHKLYSIIDFLIKKEVSPEKATDLTSDINRFLSILSDTIYESDGIGKQSAEWMFELIAFNKVREMNDLHNESDSKRFETIKQLNAKSLFHLIVDSGNHMYTSTFNGAFDELKRKIDSEGIDMASFFENIDYKNIRIFIKFCSNYDRMNEFFDLFAESSLFMIKEKMIKNLDEFDSESESLNQAMALADVLGDLKNENDFNNLVVMLEDEFSRLSQDPSKENTQKIYGILLAMFGENFLGDDVYSNIKEKFPIPSYELLNKESLFENGKNIQRYFFYDDKDGHISFANFIRQYKNKKNWIIENKKNDGYVVIRSKSGNVKIFANYPDEIYSGYQNISKELETNRENPTVIVHRGHSYHVKNTIKHMEDTNSLIVLGSCGGANEVKEVLQRSPKAHVISTKGTGTMYVNDPILFSISDTIRRNKAISWPDFWKKISKRLGSNKKFKNYIPPYENMGLSLLRSYQSLK